MIKKSKGITLIALVISIIVMLIMAGISINLVIGDNGLIVQAQDAKIMSELSNILFDLESDILDVKMKNNKYKMSAMEIMRGLAKLDKGYIFNYIYNSEYGICSANLMIDSDLADFRISVNGDAYVDNYKRGSINFSDMKIEEKFWDNYFIRASDAYLLYQDNVAYLLSDNCLIEGDDDYVIDVVWYNENAEAMAICERFCFFPFGYRDYTITNINIEEAEVVDILEDTDLINTVTDIYEDEGTLYAEVMVFHYLADTTLNFYVREDDLVAKDPSVKKSVNVDGTNINRAGVVFSTNPKFTDNFVIASNSPDAVLTQNNNFASTEQYLLEVDEESMNELRLMAKKAKTTRIYYSTFVESTEFLDKVYDQSRDVYRITYNTAEPHQSIIRKY